MTKAFVTNARVFSCALRIVIYEDNLRSTPHDAALLPQPMTPLRHQQYQGFKPA
jgi:hypothetical protein